MESENCGSEGGGGNGSVGVAGTPRPFLCLECPPGEASDPESEVSARLLGGAGATCLGWVAAGGLGFVRFRLFEDELDSDLFVLPSTEGGCDTSRSDT